MHVEDLIKVERELGYRYETADSKVEHYQWICPRCRRALLALAQGRLRFPRPSKTEGVVLPAAMPEPVNPGLGEGPLDIEDRENFHP
jgi:ribosomal protein S27AE